MVIRNKDGSIYKLTTNNPLTFNQEWKNVILYNCTWKGEIVKDVKATPIQKLPKIEVREVEIEEQHDDVQTICNLSREGMTEKIIKNIVRVHCLPAEVKEEVDPLYEEVRENIVYGEKMAFEAIVVEREDLIIKLWTNYKSSKDSIIFPSVFVKGNIKFGDYRWWRIQEQEEKEGGFLITAIPSDVQPDFSL